MAFKDILLHLDNSAGCPARIDLAVDMARLHGARLKGIYVVTHSYYTPGPAIGETIAVARIEALFKEKSAQNRISAEWHYIDWPVVGVGVSEIIDIHAYYSDLVIVSQPDHSAQNNTTPVDLPERLGLGTGRPVLVVPYSGDFTVSGQRVMIAWRAGRESSRIVNDAMPILEKARHVSVVTVSTQGDEKAENDALKLCEYLACHGIAAYHDQILSSAGFPVGDVLLNHACEKKMDLLAMGAFAPNRRGVFALGPVARHLMNHMTLPVLISH
ncbi:MAG TPA: universal stress protein [Dongiaceae bacterium]|nr:universal stress protein [Dongiaceae bacterium]